MSAAPRTMQARLVSRRCAPARRWLSADRCGRGAALARGRRGTPVRRSRSCAPRSGRDGLGRLGAGLCIYIYAYMRRWQGSWERGRFEICRSKKSRLSGASRAIGAWDKATPFLAGPFIVTASRVVIVDNCRRASLGRTRRGQCQTLLGVRNQTH